MALHSKKDIKDRIYDDFYASSDLLAAIPKYKMPENEQNPKHAYQAVFTKRCKPILWGLPIGRRKNARALFGCSELAPLPAWGIK